MGGKSFPNTSPIDQDTLPYFENLIETLIRASFGRGYIWETTGSCRHIDYRNNEITYGDYDCAVVMNDADWVLFEANLRDANFSVKRITPHCFSVEVSTPHPFKPKTITHQLDFNQSQNINFSRDMFWKSKTSMYKSAHRNILLQAYLNIHTTKEDIWGDVEIRTKEYLDHYEGLVFLVQARNMYAKNVRYTTIDKRTLKSSKDHSYVTIVESFFPEIRWYELDCFETIYAAILKKYFVEDTANDMIQMIMREAGFMIQSAKLEMPHEIKCWVEFD